jgi:hypothetical protein
MTLSSMPKRGMSVHHPATNSSVPYWSTAGIVSSTVRPCAKVIGGQRHPDPLIEFNRAVRHLVFSHTENLGTQSGARTSHV